MSSTDGLTNSHQAHRETQQARIQAGAARREGELLDVLDEELRRRMRSALARSTGDGLAGLMEAVREGKVDPYSAALEILGDEKRVAALVEPTGTD